MTTTYNYTGKVVIVTGGGRGLGLGITNAFVKTGATVIITARTEKTFQNICEKLREELDADIHYFTADGTDEKRSKRSSHGSMRILVN